MDSWKQKRTVMQRYDLTAQMYDQRYRQEQTDKYQAALDNLNLEPDSAVLDVGCGTGLFFEHIAGKAKDVVGVDVSRELLLQAKKRAKACGNVGVVLADADYLPFRAGVFGGVFAFTVLQNVPEPLVALREFVRVAFLGGFVVVTGLKRVTVLPDFLGLLGAVGLHVVRVRDDDTLRCYVVTTVLNQE
ncbi:MAG: methyltransferase domain-containing protein [Candidatus Bathyarchaeota archaeon]|nr:methyltransferase domain-containing protein [Candidatus Bathyarchaeota archaeon]